MSFTDYLIFFFFSSRRRHTRLQGDWSSDVCSSDLVAGEKLNVPRLVPREQQVIDVELAHDAVAALELDRAHGAAAGRAADGEDGVHQGAEGAQRVRAVALRIADHEQLDRAKLAHSHQQLEVSEVARHRAADVGGEVL